MTGRPEPLAQAIDDHDITLALTPAQLVVVVVGVWLLVKLLRSRRG